MSLIHEALKKAEEQRRLGQPPDLASPFARPRERAPLLPFLLVAIVIAVGVGWWLLRTPATTDKPASVAATATTATQPPAAGVAAKPGNANAGGLERTAARSSSAERLPVAPPPPAPPTQTPAGPGLLKTAPVAVAPAAKDLQPDAATAVPGAGKVIALNTTPGGDTKPEQEALAKAMNQAAPPAVVDTRPLDAASKPSGVAKVDRVPMPDTGPTLKPTTSATPATPTMATKPIAAASMPASPASPSSNDKSVATQTALAGDEAAASAASADKLPLFWQLPYATRKDLPQLAVSMHVFAADPDKRFIVINGDHKAEGDPLGADLFVREIRSDGVVMEFRGQRFMVPRGG